MSATASMGLVVAIEHERRKAVGSTTIQEVLVADVIPTPDNPRVINEKDESFKELVTSVKGAGVLVPVHVRPHPTQKGKWDLRAGERRLRASKTAGRETIPAIVHEEMTDTEAFELTFTENFVREDLTPVEQGRSVEILLAKHNGDIEAVAAHLGRSRKWVTLRENLKKLSSASQKSLAEEAALAWLPLAHLELIARHEPEVQKDLLGWMRNNSRVTLKDLSAHIKREYLHALDGAVREMKMASPNCADCTKRSSVAGLLFEEEGKKRHEDRCLDPVCWEKKRRAWLLARAIQLRTEHKTLSIICDRSSTYNEDQEAAKTFGTRPLEHWNFDEAKEGSKGAEPALVVSGPEAGRLKWIIRHGTDSGGGSAGRKGTVKTLQERREALERRRAAMVIKIVEQAIEEANAPIGNVFALAAAFGTERPDLNGTTGWEYFDKHGTNPLTVETSLWEMLRERLTEDLRFFSVGQIRLDEGGQLHHAERICALLGLSFSDYTISAEAKIPEPKSWAKLQENGKPKPAAKTEKPKSERGRPKKGAQ